MYMDGRQYWLFVVCTENGQILLANSKPLSFSALMFGPAQERLDWELKVKRWRHRQGIVWQGVL